MFNPSSSSSSGAFASPDLSPVRSRSPQAPLPPPQKSSDIWDFDLLSPASQAAPTTAASTEDDTGFDLGFESPAQPAHSSNHASRAQDLFGDDQDQGNIRLGASDGEQSGGDDNLFEDFGLQSKTRPRSRQPSTNSRRSPSHPSGPSRSREPSPPPHVLGQLVEMGFSVSQSRVALLASRADGGNWDVERALEVLVQDNDARGDIRRSQEDRDVDRPRRPHASERGSSSATEGRHRQPSVHSQDNGQPDIIAQASVFGRTVFNRANAYWKTSREQLQKTVDEKMKSFAAQEGTAGRGKGKMETKPRWLVEAEAMEKAAAEASPQEMRAAEPFKDSDEEEEVEQPIRTRPSVSQLKRQRPPPSSTVERPTAVAEPRIYVSSARRRVPQRTARTPDSTKDAPTPTPRQPSPPPPPKPSRPVITATPAQVSAAASHKEKGNSLFKLGRFGEAEQAYSRAIDALPAGHLHLVPLYNNRANARLQSGEDKAACDDCTTVLDLSLGKNSGPKVDVSALERESTDIDLREHVGKALSRRARAYEASEKWVKAKEDWGSLMAGGEALSRGAGGLKVVSEGLSRCRRATGEEKPRPQARAPPPRPKPKAVTTHEDRSKQSSAVKALRAHNATLEEEENQRLELKESVDERIMGWKGGKEANLRALIASVDAVLWPELGWTKVGMHELLSDSQVKIKYMRAISKVHPDKVRLTALCLRLLCILAEHLSHSLTQR
jgi:tetratricopeptide (TPR) repeat protein